MLKIRKWVKNEKGFTLIELLVVLVIIGIIAALAVPKLSGVVSDAKTETCNANKATINHAIEMYKARFPQEPVANIDSNDIKTYYMGTGANDWPTCPVNGPTGTGYVVTSGTLNDTAHNH